MDWLGLGSGTVILDRAKLPAFDRMYNGAIFIRDDRHFVVLRCHNDNTAWDTGFWNACKRSELWLVELDPTTCQPLSHRKLEIPLPNCEDPRAVMQDGKLHVFFTAHVAGSNKYDPHVAIFDAEFKLLELNPIGLFGRGEIEKNWTFFHTQGAWHAVYSLEPWQVVCFDSKWRGHLIHKSTVRFGFRFGDLRGGTPPVMVDGFWWTWFHAVWVHPERNMRVYSAGVVQFEGRMPFAPLGCSTYPLIHPNLADEGWVRHGRIVFPCGAVFNEKRREWVVSSGSNDSELRLDFIRHEKVVDKWLWRTVKPDVTMTGGIG